MSSVVVLDRDSQQEAFELTALGKRLEILRIERGISKQGLARQAGTSRQQLWRVMTGKSELTSSLRDRLARALTVEPAAFASSHGDGAHAVAPTVVAPSPIALTVSEYLSDVSHLVTTLRTMPAGDNGRKLKRALINALEDVAVESGRALPLDYSEVHRRVLAGDL